jgi:hypothetical protein
MSIKLLKVETVPLTFELAVSFHDMKALKGERRLKKSRLNYFRNALRTSTFRDVVWAKCTVATDLFGNLFRGDGQHTSTVLSELSEAEFPQNLSAVVMTYRLDNDIEDAAQFFELFNNPVSARTPDDRMHLFRAKYPALEEADIPEGFLTKVAKIIASYRTEVNKNVDDNESTVLTIYPPRERGLYFSDPACQDFALWLWQWHTAPRFSSLFKLDTELMVDTYYHWQERQEEATMLWSEVFQSNNPDNDAPGNRISMTLHTIGNVTSKKQRYVEKARRTVRAIWAEYLEQHVLVTT